MESYATNEVKTEHCQSVAKFVPQEKFSDARRDRERSAAENMATLMIPVDIQISKISSHTQRNCDLYDQDANYFVRNII